MLKCKECTFHKQSSRNFLESNFISGNGNKNADIMVVFDSPFIYDLSSNRIGSDPEYGNYLNKFLEKIDMSMEDTYVTSFIKCFISDKKKKPTKPIKNKCSSLYLKKEIEEVKPKVILLLGKMVTNFFIPDMTGKTPLKQVVGNTFYSEEFKCNFIPLYDMFYLTNFSQNAVQVKQTERGIAKSSAILKEGIVKNNISEIEYSSEVNDISLLGNLISCDIETTGLDEAEEVITTIAFTDVNTLKTVSLDAESYGVVKACSNPRCNKGKVKNLKKVEALEKAKTKKQIEKAESIEDLTECEKCDGTGKEINRDKVNNRFYKEALFPAYELIKNKKLVFHNGSFDLKFLKSYGFDLSDNLAADTRLMQFLLNPSGVNSLGFLVELYYGVAYKDNINRKKILSMDLEPRRYYCAEDTYYTAKVFIKLYKELKEKDRLKSNRILTNTIKVIADNLEYHGIGFDNKIAQKIIDYYETEKEKAETKFKKRFKLEEKFNLNSSKQLCKLLYEDLNLPVLIRTDTVNPDTGEKNPSANAEAIEKLASKRPALKSLLDYRTAKGHIEKLVGYMKSTNEEGRIRSSFNIFSPDSSRLMSSKPNIQNAPRDSEIKKAFISREGYSFLYYDMDQVEFRIWVALSKDKRGIKFINEDRDIHSFIASHHYREDEKLFLDKTNAEYQEKRNRVKPIVYGSMFGRSPEGIVKEHGGSIEEAKKIQRVFFSLFKEGYFWLKDIEKKVIQDKALETPFGTPRYFHDVELADEYKREQLIREGKSFIIQSWAVEMFFMGMYKVWKKIREKNLDAIYVHQIHDAGILEVKDDHVQAVKKILEEEAQTPYSELPVKLTAEVKIGKSWDEIA